MEEQIVKTDRINTYSNSNESKYPKDALSLPLITSNLSSELNRQNSLNKIDKNKIGQKRGFKKVGKKKRIVTARSSNQKRRFKINKDLDLVYKLNMEVDVDQIFKDDLQLRKEREKIDNSPDIMARRLNAYKHGSDKKNEKKMEVDSKEKEKYIEKEFKDELEVLENIQKDCNIINMHINQIRELIDEYKLEINVYNNYGDEMEKKYLKEVKEKEKEKNKLELLNNINNINNEVLEQSNENDEEEEGGNNKNNNENDMGNMGLPIKNSKQEKYEYINNAFNMMRRKKEERLKFIKESIIQKEEELKLLEEQQKKLIGK